MSDEKLDLNPDELNAAVPQDDDQVQGAPEYPPSDEQLSADVLAQIDREHEAEVKAAEEEDALVRDAPEEDDGEDDHDMEDEG